ncbi:hypothetical protein HDV00_001285, partial [Rhizophlyctis rosea]
LNCWISGSMEESEVGREESEWDSQIKHGADTGDELGKGNDDLKCDQMAETINWKGKHLDREREGQTPVKMMERERIEMARIAGDEDVVKDGNAKTIARIRKMVQLAGVHTVQPADHTGPTASASEVPDVSVYSEGGDLRERDVETTPEPDLEMEPSTSTPMTATSSPDGTASSVSRRTSYVTSPNKHRSPIAPDTSHATTLKTTKPTPRNSTNKPRKIEAQLQVLRNAFSSNKFPSKDEMVHLSTCTGLTYKQVRQWMSQERQKVINKRKGGVHQSPQDVPTTPENPFLVENPGLTHNTSPIFYNAILASSSPLSEPTSNEPLPPPTTVSLTDTIVSSPTAEDGAAFGGTGGPEFDNGTESSIFAASRERTAVGEHWEGTSEVEFRDRLVAVLLYENLVLTLNTRMTDDHGNELAVVPIVEDGNCLPRALAHCTHGRQDDHANIRDAIISFIRKHPHIFEPFFGTADRNGPGRHQREASRYLADADTFNTYLHRLAQDGEDMDELCLRAAAESLSARVSIYQWDGSRYQLRRLQPGNHSDGNLRHFYLFFISGDRGHYEALQIRPGKRGTKAVDDVVGLSEDTPMKKQPLEFGPMEAVEGRRRRESVGSERRKEAARKKPATDETDTTSGDQPGQEKRKYEKGRRGFGELVTLLQNDATLMAEELDKASISASATRSSSIRFLSVNLLGQTEAKEEETEEKGKQGEGSGKKRKVKGRTTDAKEKTTEAKGKDAVNRLLGDKRLSGVEGKGFLPELRCCLIAELIRKWRYDCLQEVEKSYLDHIVGQCRQYGIDLCWVRGEKDLKLTRGYHVGILWDSTRWT